MRYTKEELIYFIALFLEKMNQLTVQISGAEQIALFSQTGEQTAKTNNDRQS